MSEYKVAEVFASINGEGVRAGQLAVFVRFCGCNLNCLNCDTTWANPPDAPGTIYETDRLVREVRKYGIRNVTVTGGEPLLNRQIGDFFRALTEADPGIRIEVETNGSISPEPFLKEFPAITWTMDYKLPGSGMESRMDPEAFRLLRPCDTVKFVVGSREDLLRATEVTASLHLTERCHVFYSPVFGRIDPEEIVEFMKEFRQNEVTLQLQMHKVIWDPNARGV